MRCERCLTPLDDDALFCPLCGCRVDPAAHAADDTGELTDALNRLAMSDDATDSGAEYRELAERLDRMDAAYPASDDATPFGYEPEPACQPYRNADWYAPPVQEQQPAYQPYGYVNPVPEPQQPYGYADAYSYSPDNEQTPRYPEAPPKEPRETEDFEDGYDAQPAEKPGAYRKTSAGKRVASVFICILMALMLLYVVTNLTIRLTLTEKNIRSATDSEKLVTQHLITDIGDTTALDYLHRLIGSNKLAEYHVTDETLKSVLKGGRISTLTANILNDYTRYLLNDQEPTHLNGSYISQELERFNDDLSNAAGYPIRAFDPNKVYESVNGGDMSFLSIDSSGGYFYRHYQFNPKTTAMIFSLPILIISAVIALLCLVMIFALNSQNPPAGLRFCGVVLVVVGCLFMLSAIGCLVVTFIKDIWIVTELLRQAALWMGVISGVMLTVGALMLVIAGALIKRAKKAAGAAAA